jgi:hypothetical protein
VVDCLTGERVARDPDEGPAWFNEAAPEALGVGPLQGEWVPVAGLAGGSLPAEAPDGWRVFLDSGGVLVHAPDHQDASESFTVQEHEELRAWGFYPTARPSSWLHLLDS